MTSRLGTRQTGMTLVELLIALSLSVMISTVAYRFLDTAVLAESQAETVLSDVMAMEAFFVHLSSDLQLIADRSVVKPAVGVDPMSALFDIADDKYRPALLASAGRKNTVSTLTQRDGSFLWFTRRDWVNPQQQARSQLQRVLYRLDQDGQLWRDYWPERNQPLSTIPAGSRLLLDSVQELQVSYLAPFYANALDTESSAQWYTQWPPQEQSAKPLLSRLPAAIRVHIKTSQLGSIERMFWVGGA
jgi:general secretion pathway protein J